MHTNNIIETEKIRSTEVKTGPPTVNWIVNFGYRMFHIRNFLFPVFYLALFIPSPEIFESIMISDILGLLFISLGFIIRGLTIGLAYVIKGGKNRHIYAESLVTSGIYKICRNPLYLGNLTLLLGFAVFSNSFIFLSVFFPLFVFIYYSFIKAEEDFLGKKFGLQFKSYKNRVNSILPELNALRSAFQGHKFNFKKVIKKEYNTLFVYLSGILLLLIYHDRITWVVFLVNYLILLLLFGLVKILKKNYKLD